MHNLPLRLVQWLSRRLFYGWVIVAVCSVVLVAAFGVRLSFTVFFVALIDEFGWTRASTSLIFSVTMIIFTAGSALAGFALDRFGVRVMFGLGAGLIVLGLLLSSRIHTFPQLVVSYGVLTGAGITILGLTQQGTVIARWFRRRLGVAIGIAFAGTGVGSLVVIPAVSWGIERVGWRSTMQGLALLVAVMLPFILIFLRLTPRTVGLTPEADDPDRAQRLRPNRPTANWTLSAASRTPAFWLLIAAGLGCMGPIRLLTVHQLAIMNDAGFAVGTGARVVGIAGATTAVTFIVGGLVSDRFGRTTTYLLGGLCLAGAYAVIARLTPTTPTPWLWLYGLLYGMGEGSRSSLVTAVGSDLFPGDGLGAINGAVGSAFGAGAALYPWLAGRIFDATLSYSSAYWLAVGTIALSVGALWLAPRIHQTETAAV